MILFVPIDHKEAMRDAQWQGVNADVDQNRHEGDCP